MYCTDIDERNKINCGWGERIPSWNNCVEGQGYLMNLGSARCAVNAAPACARVSCSHTCGIFLCNKLGHRLEVA